MNFEDIRHLGLNEIICEFLRFKNLKPFGQQYIYNYYKPNIDIESEKNKDIKFNNNEYTANEKIYNIINKYAKNYKLGINCINFTNEYDNFKFDIRKLNFKYTELYIYGYVDICPLYHETNSNIKSHRDLTNCNFISLDSLISSASGMALCDSARSTTAFCTSVSAFSTTAFCTSVTKITFKQFSSQYDKLLLYNFPNLRTMCISTDNFINVFNLTYFPDKLTNLILCINSYDFYKIFTDDQYISFRKCLINCTKLCLDIRTNYPYIYHFINLEIFHIIKDSPFDLFMLPKNVKWFIFHIFDGVMDYMIKAYINQLLKYNENLQKITIWYHIGYDIKHKFFGSRIKLLNYVNS
jgi:hypothetical protein